MRERDHTWGSMIEVAERMTARYDAGDSLKVAAYQRRNRTGVEQGLKAWDKWTDYVELVRTRRYFSRSWTEVQPVARAASKIGTFLRERLDQTD
jgi:hypothetical protein